MKALKYVEQLREYIGASKSGETKDSLIVRLMERGIVVHHGSMPLKMRLIIEEFVRGNHAKLCFATSTLKQGINMPFDAVFIDNYNNKNMDVLTLKNLIGRAGRTTDKPGTFEFGFTLIEQKHLSSFCKRINDIYKLRNESALEADIKNVSQDNLDLVEAIRGNTFDNETRLTESQLERLQNSEIDKSIKFILDHILLDGRVLTGKEYYEKLTDYQRKKIKDAFKNIYVAHLRRKELTSVEQSILSTAIPILLWHIQGKTFKEVLALRYSYLTKLTERRKIKALVRSGELSQEKANEQVDALKVRFSQAPTSLPNVNARRYSDFKENTAVLELDYDTLVFDTYDYIDKVISLSLSDPLCAAFILYYERVGDTRAATMCNYIRYGTNDEMEIWLLRYGFAFEDIAWIKQYIRHIDEQRIEFFPSVLDIGVEQLKVIERYL
jgi:polyhydroxyalkanoate synthesis regulator phasin